MKYYTARCSFCKGLLIKYTKKYPYRAVKYGWIEKCNCEVVICSVWKKSPWGCLTVWGET